MPRQDFLPRLPYFSFLFPSLPERVIKTLRQRIAEKPVNTEIILRWCTHKAKLDVVKYTDTSMKKLERQVENPVNALVGEI